MFKKIILKTKQFIMLAINKKVTLIGDVKILGPLPHFKIPRNGVVIFGNNVVLNSDFSKTNTSLTYRCKFVTGYDGKIQIGDNTMFNGVCVVSYKQVTIGKNCQIASSTMISDTDFHPVDPSERELQVTGQEFKFTSVKSVDIVIADNVWVGWNCTILKGVIIGENSIVAAGSVVTSGIYPPNCIIAGNPAKVVKYI
jgi:acetyltransferase-like isoleucine patch superfamily enzyme